ncbi:hypothetical protein [Companilactobacillus nodensis]|uniref:Uncharacterized protein n=1 Tax=Companilactobacillus nodensis DSM 19682 = JCM 14932 = NBRC 107160 TaxID=1423775 RepID=A0A0R1KAI3_9LACO|nr:hypothetical protein [Companilactobacillus nodensis]KRK80379.1 hypothetical protein FD03_GL001798 [Companilactobacillus nodensis DSM 19682 = JCM 14932 = NBRC 107160]
MADNALTKVARIASKAAQGATYKDAKGNIQIIKPAGDSNYMDFTNFLTSTNGTGGSTGGNTDQNHPAAGADYYAGSLADGEITERYLLYQRDESVAEQTGSQTVTLQRDVGSTFNMVGDGATFLIHLQKTAMTKGTKGSVTDIKLNYDPNNIAKDGYFTTTSPYPIYIKASDLGTKKTLTIPINGIGENLSGKNVKAPQLNVTFNGNGTMTFESVTGYDNDGNSAGATGANYEVVVDVIATFSTQPAVAQLPASVNLFSGSASGDIALSGVSNFFENSMDGIEITLDDYVYFYNLAYSSSIPVYRIKSSNFVLSNTFKISKEELIDGININIILKPFLDSTSVITIPFEQNNGTNEGIVWGNGTDKNFNFKGVTKSNIIIGKSSLSSDFEFTFKNTRAPSFTDNFNWNVLKISPYKN